MQLVINRVSRAQVWGRRKDQVFQSGQNTTRSYEMFFYVKEDCLLTEIKYNEISKQNPNFSLFQLGSRQNLDPNKMM